VKGGQEITSASFEGYIIGKKWKKVAKSAGTAAKAVLKGEVQEQKRGLQADKEAMDKTKACSFPDCKETENLKHCTVCKVAYYCGKDHQRQHWKSHKLHCESLRAEKAGENAAKKAAKNRRYKNIRSRKAKAAGGSKKEPEIKKHELLDLRLQAMLLSLVVMLLGLVTTVRVPFAWGLILIPFVVICQVYINSIELTYYELRGNEVEVLRKELRLEGKRGVEAIDFVELLESGVLFDAGGEWIPEGEVA